MDDAHYIRDSFIPFVLILTLHRQHEPRTSFNLDNLWIIVSFIVSFSLATGWADESYKQTERNNLRIAVIVDHQESWRRTNFGKLLPENHSFLPLTVEGASTFDFLKIR